MSGHSKWATIKRKKGALDAKRGKLFTKLIKEITVAARMGGGNVDGNPRLRKAVTDARGQAMPADTIKRAIQRGTGELEGANYEEIVYEGTGPGGTLFIVEALTDNKNRTTSELRKMFSTHGGNLGESGCVGWMFQAKGQIVVEKSAWKDEDKLMTVALDAGAEDIKSDDPEIYEIVTAPADFEKVRGAVTAAGISPASAEVTLVPSTRISLVGADGEKMGQLLEDLENHDDVKDVYANADVAG